MQKLTIKETAEAVGGKYTKDGEFTSVCLDSREIEPGCLFVAIKGENFDGHSFVSAAVASGAVCALVSCEVPGVSKDSLIIVDDTRRALLSLAAYYRSKFVLPTVGLTGSVGKTTTKEMIAAVLRKKYSVLATEGNKNNEIGLPRMCFRLDESIQAAVLEMGMSAKGEISALTKVCKPTIGVITNIGVSHIEKLGSRQGILEAKLEILDGMKPHCPLVLNGDDDMLAGVSERLTNPVIYYSVVNENADCRASQIVQTDEGMRFVISYKGESAQVYVPAIGMHNVYNALAAYICGRLVGLTSDEAVAGLADYIPTGMRQHIVRKNGVTIIEDCYNASPDSIKAALGVLSDIKCSGRRIAVLGEMLELGEYAIRAHRECGALVEQSGADLFYALGGNAMYYIEGASNLLLEGRAKLYDDKEQLACDLCDEVSQGDAVLFKASRAVKLEDVMQRLYDKLGNGKEEQ